MRVCMPTVSSMGLDVLLRPITIQASLFF